MKVLALAGGVGGAKLALGLCRLLAPRNLTVVVNTGDDEVFHGLQVCPDLDTVTYTLAGLVNTETGWGLAGDTFNALGMLEQYGADTWFRIGDKDLATHIERTRLLKQGRTLSQVTRQLCVRLGVKASVVPMSDQPVRTRVKTDQGEMAFQEYFVQRQCQPRIRGVRFQGAKKAEAAPGFRQALDKAEVAIFCPSNPMVSIAPILSVKGARPGLRSFRGPRIAVSPIVGGQALKGPAAKMFQELGEEVSCVGVARRLASVCDVMVIDSVDAHQAQGVRAAGLEPVVLNTIMNTDADKERLAFEVLEVARERLKR